MSLAVIDRNDVVLRGRLSAAPELRPLPSGDTLLVFKLVVRRDSPRPRGPKSDVITCVSLLPGLQRYAAAWTTDDVVEVEGALQRRFWRTPTGTAVAYEVTCRRGRKVARAAQRPSAQSG
ncbi:single-stranded DNA-binding protein [Modestobacter sp. VKM Ac-2983]|uniref:single-stranded DNA-binding protein n=1 Tax=Modestobacter sp. VKM Ac-2983 TaxID=3004137 RepID=UPI0022ABA6D7|nr:single-stranded DNA-binding protein [Modestobacter sp. VKM Ac-2983]MCZ2805793.1 single-stranded DNA-binding protein [Modestobacter sp. VKM Ac-2983]